MDNNEEYKQSFNYFIDCVLAEVSKDMSIEKFLNEDLTEKEYEKVGKATKRVAKRLLP